MQWLAIIFSSISACIAYGIVATWWVGLILGIPLATIARIGSRSKMTVGSLIRPVTVIFGCIALLATLEKGKKGRPLMFGMNGEKRETSGKENDVRN